jgi:predicted DNA-binding WGR domain protein
MLRRFEYIAGSSAKFYEVTVDGSAVHVRYGRIGTEGQTSTKTFADETSAQRHADKLIAQKTGKGYVECTAC